ncbi:U-box domain-containing protein 11 [Phtheirospermum japonicum]|uniref:RING-type E3 ubiquitin transferase n=1 Tax=Phtheirospermum japonicum TaxID=374723 RepID=A0A830BFF5_9LAMI|nr:U-box domain-containing protein 11 [Phtheirospermum japonicum]
MAGGETTAAEGGVTAAPLRLIRDLVKISTAGFSGSFKRDCADLARRVSLLAHLLEEIRDCNKINENGEVCSSSSSYGACFSELTMALQAAKRLVVAANSFDDSKISSDGATKKIYFQFQCVTWKLEKSLTNLPYVDFDISEEVQEQVDLVRAQLRRATERYGGPLNSTLLCRALSQPLDKEIDPFQPVNRLTGSLNMKNIRIIDHEAEQKTELIWDEESLIRNSECEMNQTIESSTCKSVDENKKVDSPTYERSYIQKWIDCGNKTCPKTQQKLRHLTLTPNYVLRSLISQWCLKHNVEHTTALTNGKLKKPDGSFRDVTDEITAIKALVRSLSSRSTEARRSAVSEIRSLSKRSTDNRILLAEAGAIPILVNLLTSDDGQIQDNAVTSILNMSIYENNKGLIMLANAVPSIVQVLRAGSPEAKENAAATLFSLSLADENKIIIGASGAISALVDLLSDGGPRGKKDAATALFNLCMYHGNKGRAVRAGIVPALLKMMTDWGMVDEALTILSVLAGHGEAKSAIVKGRTIPVLIDLLRTGLARNKENACAILVSLCKRDKESLACLSRLGAMIPLSEIARNGTERAKRKAGSLLESLRKAQQV